jgi:hypothetical protein
VNAETKSFDDGGIDQQIQDDLQQLDAISGYYREPGAKTSLDKSWRSVQFAQLRQTPRACFFDRNQIENRTAIACENREN